MKKIYLMLLLAVIPAGMLSAQRGRHELELGLSAASPIGVLVSTTDWSTELYNLYEPRTEVETGPSLSLSYSCRLLPFLKVGALCNAAWYYVETTTPMISNTYPSSSQNSQTGYALSLLPMVTGEYFHRPLVTLYGRVAAGVGVDLGAAVHPSRWGFAWEVVPIGIQLGRKHCYYMAEVPVGSSCIGLRMGVGFRF